MRDIQYIVIHATGGWKTQTLKDIQAGWRTKGWRRPGYHYIYAEDGKETHLAPENDITNGVKGFNKVSIHLAYTGGLKAKGVYGDTLTALQKRNMLIRIKDLRHRYPNAKIVGHRDLSPDLNGDGKITPNEFIKVCPCFDVRVRFAELFV